MLSSCALLVALGAAPAVPAPEINAFQWRFRQGDVFYVESTNTSKQTCLIQEVKQVQDSTRHTVSRYTVKKINPDRSVVLEHEILSVKCEGDAGDKVLYEMFVGSKFTVSLDARGKVSRVEGYKELLAKADQNPAAREMLKMSHSEDTVKDSYVSFFEVLPGKSVSVGKTWSRRSTVGMGPLGTVATDTTYKYAGTARVEQRTLDKVSFTATAKFQPGGGDVQGIVLKIKSADLKMEPIEGHYHFDGQKGRLTEMTTTTPIKGIMTIEAAGMEIKMEIEGTQKAQCRILDKNPIKD